VLGAALFALMGAGQFDSIQQAVASIEMGETIYEPSGAADYDLLYEGYQQIPPALKGYYSQ